MTEQQDEERARRLLLALHPIVQRLLRVLRELLPNTTTPTAAAKSQSLQRMLLELLVQYSRLLQQVLQDTATSMSLPRSEKLRETLLEYCLQPCLASTNVLVDNNDDPAPNLTQDSVRRKIWMEINKSILLLLQTFDGSWIVSKRIQVVQSLVASLPRLTDKSTLDSDADTRHVYFQVLKEIWNEGTKRSVTTHKAMTHGLLEAWPHHSLVARVAESCLESAPATLALECLALWITQLSTQSSVWQRLFPGIFHGLYRMVSAALKDFRSVRTVGLPGIRALRSLCRAVAETDTNATKANLETGIGKVMSVMQAWSSPTKENESTKDVTASKDESAAKQALQTQLFWSRVGQNLALPLQRLILLGCSNAAVR